MRAYRGFTVHLKLRGSLQLSLVACVIALGIGCSSSPPPPLIPVTRNLVEDRVQKETPPAVIEVAEAPPEKKNPTPELRILAVPESLRLLEPGLQLVAHRVEGRESQEITSQVHWVEESPSGFIKLEQGGYVRPLGPGRARIKATLAEMSATVEFDVLSGADRPVSFESDVQPVLTRAGCNAGGCHARAEGQGGFHLSLYGFDAESDASAISRQAGGRRISRFAPEASLLLLKASGQVAHGGGRRLVPGSAEFEIIKQWIASDSSPEDASKRNTVAKVSVEPSSIQMQAPGVPHQLRVLAQFQNGDVRDVTRLAAYHSNDDSRLKVTSTGQAELLEPGQADLVVRYQSFVIPLRVSAPLNPGKSYEIPEGRAENVVDREFFSRLKELNLPPSRQSSDATFLRRVTLDLTGQLPEPDEIRAFLADTAANKRDRKVDDLLARDDHIDFWTLKLGDLLQISQARFGAGAGPYQGWARKQVRENVPWNTLVRELLTAVGDPIDPTTGGPVNYALDGIDPQAQAEQTARRFLGLRLRCAQCHDHPFDVWTQNDYYSFAAFFAQVDRGATREGVAMSTRPRVGVNPEGKLEHPRTHQTVTPRPLDGAAVNISPGSDPRQALADWMTNPENPFFARAHVNWVWAQFFGRGLAEPADDLSASNPAVHPQLLEALASNFIASGYDTRALIRTIVTSDAYGLSAAPVDGNAEDDRFFSHHTPRPLTAHQMADALAHATQVPNVFPNRSTRSRTKAIQIFDPGNASSILDTFGRCSREINCSPVGMPQLSLSQALLLIGGDAVDSKVSHVRGYLNHLLELEPSPPEIVEYLYFRTLCRAPTAQELAHWTAELNSADLLQDVAEDLFWALLNSREFAFNH